MYKNRNTQPKFHKSKNRVLLLYIQIIQDGF
jgi:hypothetical protein